MIFKWIIDRIKYWYDMFEGLIQFAVAIWVFLSVIMYFVISDANWLDSNHEPMSHNAQVVITADFLLAASALVLFIGYHVVRHLREDYREYVENYEKPKRG